jgi:hypothetical protein
MAQNPPVNPVVVTNPPAAPAAAADRTKRSKDIPLFYSQPGKDTISACLLIVRVNDTATIGNWAVDRKILEFKMCLRDRAVTWFEGLIEEGLNVDDWDVIKAEFLETYEPKYSAKTTCANFTDLNQKSEESINYYTYRVQTAHKRLTDNKPATMAVIRAAAPTIAEAKAEGILDAFKFVKHQLFLAGLKDGLRDKVLQAKKATFNESVKVARNLETIQNDHKRLNKIAAVKAELQPEEAREIIWEELTEQEIEQVAALWSRNGRFQPRNHSGPARNNGQARTNTTTNPNIVCRYCNKKGHRQKECFSRRIANAPMVDANGKPYESNRVNNVADNSTNGNPHQPEPVYEDTFVGSVTNLNPYHHLDW